MSAAHEIAALPAPPVPPRAAADRAVALVARLRREWLPYAAWSIGRTGQAGLLGIALLLAAAVFLFSTHLGVVAEVEALRSDLAAARRRPPSPPDAAAAPPGLRALPAPGELPAILRRLFGEAAQAGLAVDAGRYEARAMRSSGLVRYQLALPVTGPYPRIREFIDAALARMPAVALADLTLERRSIGATDVEAQLRMNVYTVEPPGAPGGGAGALAGPGRVVAPTHEGALFAQHSWYVPPPPRRQPPPPPPPPPPEPTAPALPYAFVGRFAPEGEAPVFFLARGDHVLQARVGDRIDGVYRLESAAAGQLDFVYLPLDVRQPLKTGAPR